MSATATLRRHLEKLGVHCEPRGNFVTAIPIDGVMWYAYDRYDGTLRLSVAGTLSPADVIKAIVGTHATMTSTCDENGVGHSECGLCGGSVSKWFKFCPWCGSRFVDATEVS